MAISKKLKAQREYELLEEVDNAYRSHFNTDKCTVSQYDEKSHSVSVSGDPGDYVTDVRTRPFEFKTRLHTESIEDKFIRLLNEWRESTENVSSITETLSNPAYQQIIDLGRESARPIVSLILIDFKDNGGYWATALHAITGENPIAPRHIGNPKQIRKAWLNWGIRLGYL